MEPDFGGWATRAGLKCSDGRTIMPNAFQHMDGKEVPLVFQHGHSDIENVLGHMKLEHREEGVYAHGFFNDTAKGQAAKVMVQHNDIKSLSIYANQLVEKAINGGKEVIHGMIREVSLVLAGANPGALIDFVRVAHSADPDDYTDLDDEAVIHTGMTLELKHEDGPTLQEAYDGLSEDAKNVVHALVEQAMKAAGLKHSEDDGKKSEEDEDEKKSESSDDSKKSEEDDSKKSEEGEEDDDKKKSSEESEDDKKKTGEGDLNHQEGAGGMTHNVFDQNGQATKKAPSLSHGDVQTIVEDAKKCGSLKEATQAWFDRNKAEYLKHGIESLEVLFPDARTLTDTPEWNKRQTEWVSGVLGGVRRTPFSRVKSIVADLTQDEARAKGYIKGTYKKEEWFGVTKRTTTPTTVYKKQQLDRDDIIDITDFDVVMWLKGEMRMMLEEELARAILFGDGRAVDDEDKIKDPMAAADGAGIRSIVNENELYATTINVNIDDANSNYYEVVEAVVRARRHYKGTGQPTFYTTDQVLTEMLLLKDETNSNRRLYNTEAELAAALRVKQVVAVEAMEGEADLVGIIVNLADYNVGADKGGEVNLFDDFDIDYNQYKYLIETRISGALTKIKSALVIKKVASSLVQVSPAKPTFNSGTGVVTIPTKTGVVYEDASDNSTLTAGAQSALAAGESLMVQAVPASGYFFPDNASDEWTFKRPEA